ncbi:MAG: [protein-PII] uridylyltransferase [Hydrogenophilales bacterium]|nr:[protein-PII] uridylyltransferase [Hydrogenophilales bacterium]
MTPTLADVAAWRAEHGVERARLIESYRQTRRAPALLRGLTRAADRLLRRVWAAQSLPAGASLVAVGGYGRGEMFPQSDIDLLILLEDRLPEVEHARFEPLVGLLWDLGLHVGHSVRTLAACLEEAANDITIRTNMLDARLLAGSRGLYRQFRQGFDATLDPLAFLDAKRLEQQHRHGRFADRALLLEPNLKESPGGLRDIQTVVWVFRAAGQPARFADLVALEMLRPEEARRLNRHLGLLERLRIQLHLTANRREDRLLFEFQERLAAEMGFKAHGPRRASELLMQQYYLAARELSLANEYLIGCLRLRLRPPLPVEPVAEAPGFRRHGNMLDIDDENQFERHPEAIFEAVLLLQRQHDLHGLTPRALRALWRAGHAIDSAFRRDPVQAARFLAILREPRGVTLAFRLLHRLGILGRYIPLFGRITGQMQHDGYHIYPVDEHTLMVLRNLRRLTVPDFAHEYPLQHRVMTAYERQDLLLLAALFHDIAKGRGGDHSSLGAVDARRFCRRLGLDRPDSEMVAWLVAQHLILSQTAQKQDLSDPDILADFAARCGDTRHLTALYLLTVADIRGTSPKVWNAWKDKLTRELYLASRRILEGDQSQPDNLEERKEAARAQLRLYGFSPGAEERFWQRLDDIYFLRQDARDIAWQTRRLLPVLGRETRIVRARLAPVGEGVEVLVFAPDEEALFARICAFFARLGYSILAARVNTTRDGHALDTFYALDTEHPQVAYRDFLNYIEHELTAELARHEPLGPLPSGRIPRQVKAFPLEPEVNLLASENGKDYVLSITAGDRPGLLANLARVFNKHGANLLTARINTLGSRAEDVFVIEGESLQQNAVRLGLEQDLLDVLKVQ